MKRERGRVSTWFILSEAFKHWKPFTNTTFSEAMFPQEAEILPGY